MWAAMMLKSRDADKSTFRNVCGITVGQYPHPRQAHRTTLGLFFELLDRVVRYYRSCHPSEKAFVANLPRPAFGVGQAKTHAHFLERTFGL
jgi:hypothetical protein